MSATERTPRERWPGMSRWRRWYNHQDRVAARRLLRRGEYERVCPPRASSAKWMVW